jgi:DNA-binding NarL/FixJ family response regulator
MNPSVIPSENRTPTTHFASSSKESLVSVNEKTFDDLPQSRERSLLIIDSRALDRQCLARCIAEIKMDMDVIEFGSMDEWKRKRHQYPQLGAILLNIGGRRFSEPTLAEEVKSITSEYEAPVIVLAETDDLQQIIKALECGARGYIPSSVGINVCIEAIALSLAGGIFVPASSLLSMRQMLETGNPPATNALAGIFTARQAEVVEALRRGKANKIIAYELNLRESTVKVHIRNIMKKVKATNRTEVAYKINDLFPPGFAVENGSPAPYAT